MKILLASALLCAFAASILAAPALAAPTATSGLSTPAPLIQVKHKAAKAKAKCARGAICPLVGGGDY